MFATTKYKGGWITESAWSKRDIAPSYLRGSAVFSVLFPDGTRCKRKLTSMKAARRAITVHLNSKKEAAS